MRGLFRTGDGQTTGRRKGQSLFNDITGGKRKIATKEKEKQREKKRKDVL